mgnify:CR=1 FL=1
MGMLSGKAVAYDIAVQNEDGVVIYYRYINDGKELEVSHGTITNNSYKGNLRIPGSVTYKNRTRIVTSIGQSACAMCRELKEVSLPTTIREIKNNAFQSCSTLRIIRLPQGIKHIGRYAFSGCKKLSSIRIPDSIKTIEKYTFSGCTKLSSITLPDSLTKIEDSAFQKCRSLSEIEFPERLSKIESYAFADCKKLKAILMGDNIESIGAFCFVNCERLKKLTLPPKIRFVGAYAFSGNRSLEYVFMPTRTSIIGAYAFQGCEKLQRVSYTDLEIACETQFANAEANPLHLAHHLYIMDNELTEIELPETTIMVGDYAFYGCDCITSLFIPDSTLYIGKEAFKGCNSLMSVRIGRNVRAIKPGAFNCDDIHNIEIFMENPIHISGINDATPVFNNDICNNATLWVPKGSAESYKSKRGWWDFIWIKER